MKKAIIIKNTSDAKMIEALKQEITAAEGRATARLLNYHDIFYYLQQVTDKLQITKKAMEGIQVSCNTHAQEFAKAYKYTPESTHFRAVFKNGTWRVTNIYRDTCDKVRVKITLTEEAEKAILNKYRAL